MIIYRCGMSEDVGLSDYLVLDYIIIFLLLLNYYLLDETLSM